jgi:hypothetical protein
MLTPIQPFPLPKKLPPALLRLQGYWKSLARSENKMPFSDDIDLASLSKLSPNFMLMDVFDRPQRFRLNHLSEQTIVKLGVNCTGKFIDEVDAGSPLDYLIAQASTTVEARAPTFYMSGFPRQRSVRAYRRVLLPTWGDGRIALLLGAIA